MPSRPLRILQMTSGLNVNGAVIYCGLLSQRLKELGHQVTAISRPSSWFRDRFESDLGPQNFFDSTLDRSRAEIRRVADFIEAEKFDLIHTHMSSAHNFGLVLKYLTGVPCIATAHHCGFQPQWRLNDFVIANSEATRKYQIRLNGVPRSRIKTVYCYTTLDEFLDPPHWWPIAIRGQQRVPEDSKMIGIVGSVSSAKGHLVLTKALPELIERYPDLTVLFVGNYNPRREPHMAKIRRYILKNNMARKIRWLGRRPDVAMLTAALDVAVVPSFKESLGLVAIEALATGTPVVASNVGGLPEIIQHGSSGLLVKRNRPKALVKAISELLDDPTKRNEMGARGAEFVKRTFDPDQLTRQVEDIYFDVLRKKGRLRTGTAESVGNRAA